MKDRNIVILLAAITLASLIFGFMMVNVLKESNECVSNPLIYGAKIASNDGSPINCTCKVLLPNFADFWFDNETMEVIESPFQTRDYTFTRQ